jgi:hypothetical protein
METMTKEMTTLPTRFFKIIGTEFVGKILDVYKQIPNEIVVASEHTKKAIKQLADSIHLDIKQHEEQRQTEERNKVIANEVVAGLVEMSCIAYGKAMLQLQVDIAVEGQKLVDFIAAKLDETDEVPVVASRIAIEAPLLNEEEFVEDAMEQDPSATAEGKTPQGLEGLEGSSAVTGEDGGKTIELIFGRLPGVDKGTVEEDKVHQPQLVLVQPQPQHHMVIALLWVFL